MKNVSPPPTRDTVRFSTAQSNRKNKKAVFSWDNMFSGFYQFFKEKHANNPSIKSNKQQNEQKQTDPLEIHSPLDQVNQFQIDQKQRKNFRQYLQGEKSVQQLVKECNHQKTNLKKSIRIKQQMRKVRNVTRFTSSLTPKDKVEKKPQSKFKFLHFLGINDMEYVKKIRIQQRYDMIRKLLQKKMIEKEEMQIEEQQTNQFEQACDFFANKIASKDILTDRVDGQNYFESIQYENRKNGIRVKKNKPLSTCLSPKQIQNEIPLQKMVSKYEIHNFAEEFIEKLENDEYLKDQKEKRKTKLQIIKDRSAKHKTTNFFWQDFHHEKIPFVEYDPPLTQRNEPQVKDIELYQYIHGIQQNQNSPKERIKKSSSVFTSRPSFTQNGQRKRHFITNLNSPKTSRLDDRSESHNSSLQSIKELHIDNLYDQSLVQQKKFNKIDRNTMHKFNRIQKIKDLNPHIIQANVVKLNSQLK